MSDGELTALNHRLQKRKEALLAQNPLRLIRHPIHGIIPLRLFKKQAEFFDRYRKVTRVMGWDGPNRGGKTFAASFAVTEFVTGWPVESWQDTPWDLTQLAMGPPRSVGCVTISKEKSIEGQQRYIWERIPKCLLDKESGRWNQKTGLGTNNPKIVLKNKSTINFLSDLSRKEQLEQFQWDLAWIDEAVDEWVFKFLIPRLTDTNGKMIITSVASKEWIHRVLRLRMIERDQQVPAPPGLIDTIDDSTMFDNELIPQSHIENSILMMGGKDSREARMRVFGQYIHLEGVVFKEYDDIGMISPTLSPFALRTRKAPTIYEGADPGYSNPFAWVFIAVWEDLTWEIFDEIYAVEMVPSEIAAMVKAKRHLHGYAAPYMPTRIDQAADESKHWGRKKVSVRQELLQAGIVTTPAPKGKGSIDAGEQIIREKMKRQELRIQRHCRKLRWEFTAYRWADKDAGTEQFIGDREKRVDANNHLIDALRYAITANLLWHPAPARKPPRGSVAYDRMIAEQQQRQKAASIWD